MPHLKGAFLFSGKNKKNYVGIETLIMMRGLNH
jgi:hypothetical protein